MPNTDNDREHYERWLAQETAVSPSHNEAIALALLPKHHDDPGWDARVARALTFLKENGR